MNATRTGEVMEAVRAKLASRALVTGDRLPSIRQFAAAMAVAPSTVVEAYDRLAAEWDVPNGLGCHFIPSHPRWLFGLQRAHAGHPCAVAAFPKADAIARGGI